MQFRSFGKSVSVCVGKSGNLWNQRGREESGRKVMNFIEGPEQAVHRVVDVHEAFPPSHGKITSIQDEHSLVSVWWVLSYCALCSYLCTSGLFVYSSISLSNSFSISIALSLSFFLSLSGASLTVRESETRESFFSLFEPRCFRVSRREYLHVHERVAFIPRDSSPSHNSRAPARESPTGLCTGRHVFFFNIFFVSPAPTRHNNHL